MKYIVFSNSINAWSIKKGLNKLGKNLDVFKSQKKSILNTSIEKVPNNSILFFTEENNLKKYLNSNSFKFYPKKFPIDLLDDKFNFANFLTEMGEIPVPYTVIDKSMPFPYYLKAKHSWKNDKKIPRGYICYSENDLYKNIEYLSKQGLEKEWFFIQKLLSSPVENNISTSGFFDYANNERNIIIVSKKTLGTGKKITDGSVVETIKDPSNLIERTINILNNLKYQGPFELEFFYEISDRTYYVMELNPRFWLQHGIFIKHYNNALLKRYLGLDTKKDWVKNSVPRFKKIIWINNIHYIKALITRKHSFIKNVNRLDGSKIYYPNNYASALYYKNVLLRKAFKKIM